MSLEKIEHRVMGDYSIAKSYKGILRIAHVMEEIEHETDIFNNNVYYGSPSTLMNISGSSSGSSKIYGFPNPSETFEGKVNRYLSEKKYKDKKLPVTDSMGNYINWNLGTDDSTIGSDMENNGFRLGVDKSGADRYFYQDGFNEKILQPLVFPVLESDELIIGLESKLIANEKNLISKESLLEIKKDEKNPIMVVSNIYDHSSSNMVYNYDTEKTEESYVEFPTYNYIKAKYKGNEDVRYRTIYKNTKAEIEEYDAFVYSQENYNYNNFKYEHIVGNDEIEYNKLQGSILEGTQIDAEVDIVNLKDYVKSIISKFMQSNVVEVPTGTVIHQYISPEKWYAKTDVGTGNVLGNNSFIGHRPSMGQRNYNSQVINDKGETVEKWMATTIQGASLKTNRLNSAAGVLMEQQEDEMEDSAFDSTKLTELIPLYKRDYVLCDGSLYHLTLSEYNSNEIDIERKYRSISRFFNLFYVLGYDYTFPKNKNLNNFYDIKKRSRAKLYTDSDGSTSFRFINEYGEVITQENYFCYEGTDEEGRNGVITQLTWDDRRMKELKEIETLYSIDLGTILAFELLMEEDVKDIDSAFINPQTLKYDRKYAEEWLKSQKIPEDFIFNSFVGDSNDTFKSYPITKEAAKSIEGKQKHVMGIPYKYRADLNTTADKWPLIHMGREVNTFRSLVKYYLPGENEDEDGTYYVCELWQIPEIQYLLDIMRAGSGERNQIFHKLYAYTFRVPNLTHTTKPKFVGSSGFSWRDQNGNMLNSDTEWHSTMSSGTISHRHAVFKGHLSDFSDNSQRDNFRGRIVLGSGDVPSGSVNYHTRSSFPQGGKNGGAGKFVTDDTGSYIWNELGESEGLTFNIISYGETGDEELVTQNILQRGDFDPNLEYPSYYSGHLVVKKIYENGKWNVKVVVSDNLDESDATKPEDITYPPAENTVIYEHFDETTGYDISLYGGTSTKYQTKKSSFTSLRDMVTYIREGKKVFKSKLGPIGTKFPKTGPYRGDKGRNKYTFPSTLVSDFEKYVQWYEDEEAKWYSFMMDEDPRFNNAEPNRCITGPPISYTTSGTANYTKNDINRDCNPSSSCYYFSPENVKVLPLIKL